MINSRKFRQTSAAPMTSGFERIGPPASVARYWDSHHVVCRSCGAIADIDCAIGPAPCLDPSDDHGFVIDEAEVVFRGLCPDCSAAR